MGKPEHRMDSINPVTLAYPTRRDKKNKVCFEGNQDSLCPLLPCTS